MAPPKRNPIAASEKPAMLADPNVLDTNGSAMRDTMPSASAEISRLSVDLDADLFAEMKVHCVRNKVKIKEYIEILLRSDLDLT